MKTKLLKSTAAHVEIAAKLLVANEVVALPTETVYGLAGNALSPIAVAKIFEAKERPSFDPLIVHLSNKYRILPSGPLQALVIAKILNEEVTGWQSATLLNSAMKHFWPGPLTFVLPKGYAIPKEVTSGQNTVALRMPSHPVFQQVLQACKLPLAAPSANRFGHISPTMASHVETELMGKIAAIVDGGACEVGVESTIVHLEEIKGVLKLTLLRPGKISISELEDFFQIKATHHQASLQSSAEQSQSQLAPGMLDQHYAPRKPLLLITHELSNESATQSLAKTLHLSGKMGVLSMSALSPTNDPREIAQKLFAALRTLDEDTTIDFIVADLPQSASLSATEISPSGLAAAIADRLNRASKNKPLKR